MLMIEKRPSQGSSPLARGLPSPRAALVTRTRIIPARAGFTAGSASPWVAPRDHPRSRGVYSLGLAGMMLACGSSPLARGLPGFLLTDALSYGIIPARAGFTPTGSRCCPKPRDHPRSRGVYASPSMVKPPITGSSPLARGLRSALRDGDISRRIIPARAGFARKPRGPPTWTPDHPRSRGVYWLSIL